MKARLLLLALSALQINAYYKEDSTLFYGNYDEHYVMRWHFQTICDFVFDKTTNSFMWPTHPEGVSFDPKEIKKPGAIIFVRDVGTFLKKMHPKIKHPYIMVTAGEYRDSVKEDFMDALDDEKIIAWFSVHACEKVHPKFYMIPLGIYQDKKYYTPREELTKQFALWRKAPKEALLYSNYGDIRGMKPERALVDKLMAEADYCYKAERLPFLEYMKDMSRFKFSLSPRGYGPDSYRNWEALLVGSIPIFLKSQLDPMFADLPVLIIDDWHQITKEFLEKSYKEITKKKYNIEKLFMDYWVKKIYQVRDEFLSK